MIKGYDFRNLPNKHPLTFWTLIILFIGFLFFMLIYVLYWLGQKIENNSSTSPTNYTLFLIVGVIALILTLTVMAVIFKWSGLADPKGTLGLPEGSVRAIIALSLILIFMISSLYIYNQMEQGSTTPYSYNGITQNQLNNITSAQIVSITKLNQTGANNQTLYNVVTLVRSQSTDAADVGKQIITVVSTLVVAIAGFYFGTQSVLAAQGKETVTKPEVGPVDPENGNPNEEKSLKISGKGFVSPQVKFVSVDDSSKNFTPTSPIMSNDTEINCKVKLPENPGQYTLIVTNSDGGENKRDKAFRINDPDKSIKNPTQGSRSPGQKPGAPEDLSPTPGNGKVDLAWKAPSSDGGSAITGYKVYRGDSPGKGIPLPDKDQPQGVVLKVTNSNLTNGQNYYYTVSAVNSIGEGQQSIEVQATPKP